jgi:hypothetical protein
MKRIATLILTANLAVIPALPLQAAADLPVEKKLIKTMAVPSGSGNDEYKVFSCRERVYFVREANKSANNGQKISYYFVIWRSGVPITKDWQFAAEDTEKSVVRFSGTCVGDRAVLTNHWEDAVHRTAGDMATTVNGEESHGPFWRADGRTIYHWYKTDGAPTDASAAYPYHSLRVEPERVEITGTVVKTGYGVYGSSVNYSLDALGKALTQHSPWYKDLSQVSVEKGSVYFLKFTRADHAWLLEETPKGSAKIAVTAGNVAKKILLDRETKWRDYDKEYLSALSLSERCQLAVSNDYQALSIRSDGLYLKKGRCQPGNQPLTFGEESRVHKIALADALAAPRIYTNDTIAGLTNDFFVYAVRTDDNKIQIWDAVVK